MTLTVSPYLLKRKGLRTGRIWHSGDGGGEVACYRGRSPHSTGQNVLEDWQAVVSLAVQGLVRAAFVARMGFVG